MTDSVSGTLRLRLHPGQLAAFHPLLRRGFWMRVSLHRPLREVLTEECGVPEEVLQERVQTIFLDGQPIDDLGFALGRSGRVLALSAAMPGLAGAVMRKGGYCAGLRDSISYRDAGERAEAGTGRLRIRLYNFMAPELGPCLLQAGIEVTGEELAGWLQGVPHDFWSRCAELRWNGERVRDDPLSLADGLGGQARVLLRVELSQ
jgi:hypothetical protein